MNKKYIIISISSALFISLATFFIIQAVKNNVVEVKTAKVVLQDIKKIISYSGSIEAESRVRVSSKIKGRIAELKVNELDQIKNGEIIARLDDSEINARLNQAKAGLIQAKADLANATILLRRIRDLFDKGIASQQELDDVQMLYDIKNAQVIQQNSLIEAIQAELEDTIIAAPISGTIIKKYVEEGELVGFLSIGPSPIVEIARLDSFEVHTRVDETDIGNIKVGMQAEVSVDAYPDLVFNGEVKEIALLSMEKKEAGINYVVKVKIDNKDNIPLRLGMTANADFITAYKKDVATVPVWSVIQRDDEEYVFVVNDSRLHKRAVKTGINNEEFIEIISGVEVGQLVVKSSAKELNEGLKAKIIED